VGALSPDSHVRHHVPRLFRHLNRDIDLSLGVLHEWLVCGDPARVSAASHVLTGIAPGRRSSARDEDEGWKELLARPWFVVDVLERTRSDPPDVRDRARAGLEAVLFSREISRTMGEPDERTVLTKQTAETMLGLLPAGAPARSFFGDLARHCTEALEEERLDDEEFPHRLR
jgi:hypothetical protein